MHHGTFQRAGDGGSPVPVQMDGKSLRSCGLKESGISLIHGFHRSGRFSAVIKNSYFKVCSRWFKRRLPASCLTGCRAFFIEDPLYTFAAGQQKGVRMLYNKVSTNLNFVEREKEVEKFWKDNQIFEKSIEDRKDCPTYMFYDGPPTANGKPHIGHVLTRTIKDMIPRYRTMKGYQVPRKAGWDTHGLPVELEVEKLLGLDGKEQIEQYGLEPFIEKCKESVWKYKGMWEDFSNTVGFWADMDDPYVTYHDDFIESEWWALKQIWEKGLLYKGFKIVPYCPRCGTPLSSHEVAQGYKDVKERSAIARFPVKGEENTYILAWTTTPWTLPSNVALCVNPNESYARVKAADGHLYYMAEALLDTVLGPLKKEDSEEPAYEILEKYVEKTWNTKNTSRCLTVQWKSVKNSIKRHFL